jgi:hypothetical protein
MTWQSRLPRVWTIAERPCSSIPANAWLTAAARTASTATCTPPSVPFLNPTGIDRPEPSWRWIWLSVVRAPIAPQQTASEMYCGMIGSRNSQPIGTPRARMSSSSVRASRSPALTSPEPSRCGSLIRPFQPVVVRGFSKYTRITSSSESLNRAVTEANRRAYSRVASTSWTLQGPTTTSSRSSSPSSTAWTCSRPARTTAAAGSLSGSSASRSAGETSSSRRSIR